MNDKRKTADRMLILLGLLAALAGPGPRAAAGELSPLKRELLEAQLEDLQHRLATAETPQRLLARGLAQADRDLLQEKHSLAGATMHREEVVLEGSSEQVESWLIQAGRAHLAPRPPLTLRALPGPGRRVALRLSLWWLSPEAFQPDAPEKELIGLRDNLLWLEKQLGESKALATFIAPMADMEGLGLDVAHWEAGQMRIVGLALDEDIATAYRERISAGRTALNKPPQLEFALRVAPAAEADLPATGLLMRDLPAADAVLLAASLSGQEVVVAAPPLPPLSGRLTAEGGRSLLDAVLGRLGLPRKRFGAVSLLAPGLSDTPPARPDIGERPLELIVRTAPAAEVWARIAAAAGTGLIAAPSRDRRLTVALKRRAAGQVARMIAWALGLRVQGDARLLTALPPGATLPLAGKDRPAVSVKAAAAPLGPLVAGLAGLAEVRVCPAQEAKLNLDVGAVAPARLLGALLGSRGLRLERADGTGRLLPAAAPDAGAAGGACPTVRTQPQGETPRLAAILGSGGAYRALIALADGFHWLEEDQTLPDGQRVLAIRRTRVILSGGGGPPHSLSLSAPDRRPPPLRREGPTQHPLATLRLTATALLPDSQPLALFEDGLGRVHQVRRGDGIGWRCGKVKSILPGRVIVELTCARPHEPKEVTLAIRPRR